MLSAPFWNVRLVRRGFQPSELPLHLLRTLRLAWRRLEGNPNRELGHAALVEWVSIAAFLRLNHWQTGRIGSQRTDIDAAERESQHVEILVIGTYAPPSL